MPKPLDAFWRAAAYCVHPRVVVLSLVPLVAVTALALVLGWMFWGQAVAGLSAWMAGAGWLQWLWAWFDTFGWIRARDVVAPVLVLLTAIPLLVVAVLLAVGVLMAPALTGLVAQRRFPGLERKRGASVAASVVFALGASGLALLAILVTMPLWLVPPLFLLLPPLIWGWLTSRVMAFDALADHASAEERGLLLRRHRGPLLGMGIVCGFLGAVPALVFSSGLLFAAAFIVLVPVGIWLYTLVFAFSALWFAHYCLDALQGLRHE
jgi:hypothetical protein